MKELTYRNEPPFILESFEKAFQSLPAIFHSMTRSRSTNEDRCTFSSTERKSKKCGADQNAEVNGNTVKWSQVIPGKCQERKGGRERKKKEKERALNLIEWSISTIKCTAKSFR